MSDLNDFPSDQIMVIRIPAIADLGVVHQGDHLVVIPGRGVVAVDTRRNPPETVWRAGPPVAPAEPEKVKYTKSAQVEPKMSDADLRTKMATITQKQVLAIIQAKGSATTMQIADALGTSRKNKPLRDRVKRVVKALREREIIIATSGTKRNHQYILNQSMADTMTPNGANV